jgi:ribosomal protein S15P/S13E
MARPKKSVEEHTKNGTYRFDRYGKFLNSDIESLNVDKQDLIKEIEELKIEIENTDKADIKKRKALNTILNQNRRILLSYKKLPLTIEEEEIDNQILLRKKIVETLNKG